MRPYFLLVITTCTCSFVACQEHSLSHSLRLIEAGAEVCPAIQELVESIRLEIDSLINSVLLPGMLEPVAVVVMDGLELPISICLTN